MYEERMNQKWIENTWMALDNMLASGFEKIEDLAAFQELRAKYEEETQDFEFTEREIIGELEKMLDTADLDVFGIERTVFEKALDRLTKLNSSKVDYYWTIKNELFA